MRCVYVVSYTTVELVASSDITYRLKTVRASRDEMRRIATVLEHCRLYSKQRP